MTLIPRAKRRGERGDHLEDEVTTTSTTASLHREMAEALRAAGGLRFGECPVCRHRISKCDKNPIWGDETCSGHLARAALEGWEKRPRLRQDEALIRELRFDLPDRDTTLRVLDSVEAALFGTCPRTGGEHGRGGNRG